MTSDELTPDDLFACRRCGDCCKGYGGTYLTEVDMDRISGFLGMHRDRFLQDACQMSAGKPVIAQAESGYCILWDQKCTIHPVKPEMCRRWPFVKSLLIDTANWRAMADTCPGMRVDVNDDQIRKCVQNTIKRKDMKA